MILDVLAFLQELLDKALPFCTIKVYLSAISAVVSVSVA